MSKFIIHSKDNTKVMAMPLFNLRYILLALMLGGLIVYVWQINSLATFGYRVRELEKQVKSLSQVNKDLENQVVNLKSLGVIRQKIDQLSLVPINQVEYLTPIVSVFAQK